MSKKKRVYKVIFFNQGTVYEIYAKGVSQNALYGFVEVEDMIFGEKSALLVDPAEERLKSEFEGVKRSYIPMQNIVRIDEVEKEGAAKVTEVEGGNVTAFPFGQFGPGGGKKE